MGSPLEECESAESPADCEQYFSTNDIIAQIESVSFHCSLPKVLSAKRERDTSSSKTFERDKAGRSSKKPKMDGENSVVHNQCMIVDAWKLSKHEESSFGKIFSYNTLLSRPDH